MVSTFIGNFLLNEKLELLHSFFVKNQYILAEPGVVLNFFHTFA